MIPYETNITEPAPEIFRIPIPVPLPLKFVYAYAVMDPQGVWIIDLGMDVPEARQAWQEANQSLKLDRRQVQGERVTLLHPINDPSRRSDKGAPKVVLFVHFAMLQDTLGATTHL